MKPERWPAGASQAMDKKTGKPVPLYGLDKNGKHHSDWAFTDVDASPTKSYMVEKHEEAGVRPYFELAFLKRPEFELYDVVHDPYCLKNLSGAAELAAIESEMKRELLNELKRTSDPRVVGPDKEVFESYKRYSPIRDFPEPDWLKQDN